MKKLLLIILIILLVVPVQAEKERDLGFKLTSLNSKFNIVYKFGTEKSKWRISSPAVEGSHYFDIYEPDSLTYNSNGGKLSFSLGKDYYKRLNNDFEFYWGPNIAFHTNIGSIINGFSLTNYFDQQEYTIDYTVALFINLGIQTTINNSIIIGAEFTPYVSIKHNMVYDGRRDIGVILIDNALSLEYNLIPSFALIIAYRFK
jgi:hypothetical protein